MRSRAPRRRRRGSPRRPKPRRPPRGHGSARPRGWLARARGREAARDLGGGARHEDAGEGVEIDGFAAGAGVASTRRSSSSNAARALSTLLPFRSRSQRWRITSTPSASATARYVSPTGFSALPPPGPATPVVDTASSVPKRARAAVGHRPGDLRADGAMCLDQRAVDAQDVRLGLVRVRHDRTAEVARRTGDLRDGMGDEPARARLGGGDPQAAREARGLQSLGELFERVERWRERVERLAVRSHRLSDGWSSWGRPVAGTATSPGCSCPRGAPASPRSA